MSHVSSSRTLSLSSLVLASNLCLPSHCLNQLCWCGLPAPPFGERASWILGVRAEFLPPVPCLWDSPWNASCIDLVACSKPPNLCASRPPASAKAWTCPPKLSTMRTISIQSASPGMSSTWLARCRAVEMGCGLGGRECFQRQAKRPITGTASLPSANPFSRQRGCLSPDGGGAHDA